MYPLYTHIKLKIYNCNACEHVIPIGHEIYTLHIKPTRVHTVKLKDQTTTKLKICKRVA